MKLNLGVKTRLKNNLNVLKKGFHCNSALSLLLYVKSWTCSCGSLVINCLYFCALKKQPPSVEDEEALRSCWAAQCINWEQDVSKILPKFQAGHMHLLTTDDGYSPRTSVKSTLWFKWVRTFRMKNEKEKNRLRLIPYSKHVSVRPHRRISCLLFTGVFEMALMWRTGEYNYRYRFPKNPFWRKLEMFFFVF